MTTSFYLAALWRESRGSLGTMAFFLSCLAVGVAATIAEAIRSLLENSSFRDALGAQGKLRAREFDWDDSARRVLDVYREVAGS